MQTPFLKPNRFRSKFIIRGTWPLLLYYPIWSWWTCILPKFYATLWERIDTWRKNRHFEKESTLWERIDTL